MAHPYAAHRQTKVEHNRVGHITKGYAAGGAVHADAAQDRKMIKRIIAEHEKSEGDDMEGKKPARRLDRARGGRAKSTTVNVIVAPQGQRGPMAGLPQPAVPAAPAGLAVPPRPPMPPAQAGVGGPPMLPPGALPPGAGPGLPIRRHGGRNYAKGGGVKSGPAFEEGKRLGTKVTHTPGKNDLKDIGRGKPITYAKGGAVEAPRKPARPASPKFDGGAGGGIARMEKAKRAERIYKKAS